MNIWEISNKFLEIKNILIKIKKKPQINHGLRKNWKRQTKRNNSGFITYLSYSFISIFWKI